MRTAVRSAWTCNNCRRRKVKCNSEDPCNNCLRREQECTWPQNAIHERAVNNKHDAVADLQERVVRLEAALRANAPPDAGTATKALHDVSSLEADNITSRVHEIQELAAITGDEPLQSDIHRHDDFDHHIIDSPRHPRALPQSVQAKARQILLEVLPERASCDKLTKQYMLNVEWIHHPLNTTDFNARYAAFWSGEGRHDLQWLALLMIVLCLGNHFDDQHQPGLQEESLYKASQELLQLSDHLTNHSISTVQTLILMGLWLNNRGRSSTHHAQLGLAIKMAMSMGYSKLDIRVTHDDSAFFDIVENPAGDHLDLKRRIWWSLVCQDFYTASSCNFTYTIQPGQCKTNLFANIDDKDLPTGHATCVAGPLSSLATASSYHVLKIPFAGVAKSMVDLYNKDALTYGAVLELETQLWKLYNRLPAHFKWDSAAPMPVSPHAEYRHLQWQRLFLGFTVHNRVLRLHRPFMAHGYTNAAMRHSRQATIQSAVACIDLAEQGQKIDFPGLKWWVVLIHIFTSGVALCIDYHFLLQHQRRGGVASLEQLEQTRRQQILKVNGLLRIAADNSVAAQKALKVLESLVKQAEQAAKQAGTGKRKDQAEEHVPQQHPEHRLAAQALVDNADITDMLPSFGEHVDEQSASIEISQDDVTSTLGQEWFKALEHDWTGPDWDELLATMSSGEYSPHGGLSTDLYDTIHSFADSFMPG